MTKFDAVDLDMDAILDEALDQLDDDDEGDNVKTKTMIKEMTTNHLSATATAGTSTSTGACVDTTTTNANQQKQQLPKNNAVANINKKTDNDNNSTDTEPSQKNKVHPANAVSDEEERLLEQFHQLLVQENDNDNHNDIDIDIDEADIEKLGNYIMGQIQSEMVNNNNNNNNNDDIDKDIDNDQEFETKKMNNEAAKKIELIDEKYDSCVQQRENEEQTKQSCSTSNGKATKKKNINTDMDEEKVLKGIFQGLMKAGGVDGQGGSIDNNDSNNIPNIDSLFSGLMVDDGDNDGEDANNKSSSRSSNSMPAIPDDFIDGMMEQLLSKELMYEPMKQVTEKFPSWLKRNKTLLTQNGDWERRNHQYECFKKLVKAYEEGDGNVDNDTTTTSGKRKADRLLELMEQVQEYGQPPSEIINEIAPGLELDEEGLPKMCNNDSNNPMMSPDGMSPLDECRIM